MAAAARSALSLLALLAVLACAPSSSGLSDPDPGLADLALVALGPQVLLPGSQIVLTGRSFPSPGDGSLSLLLSGNLKSSQGVKSTFDVRLRAEYVSATEAHVLVGAELFSALGTTDGTFDAHAVLIVESAIDLSSHNSPPLRVDLEVRSVLQPVLATVEMGDGPLHPNDWVVVHGDGLLLGGSEGQTVAVLDGCFVPDGVTGECTSFGRPVVGVEVPLRPLPTRPLDRHVGIFAYSPSIHGIRPGRFAGQVLLKNQQIGTPPVRSDSRALAVTQVAPELRSFTPSAASLGQYVELQGAGFIGGRPGEATLVRLLGQFMLAGAPLMIPVDLDIVIEPVRRYPDGPVGRYVLDETDALGQALAPRGGLRQAAGTFNGTATLILRAGKESVTGLPTAVQLTLLPVKQLVLVKFLPSYRESLRLFGLRAVDLAVRARVFDVARRDYAGANIEFREVDADAAPPSDFALYTVVEIGGSDPNGLGYLGYDNTPGRDRQNLRLYDRIGGVNAVTQNDGAPGYGGVFAEQLLGFSAHPGNVEPIQSPGADRALFDRIFDPLRPDVSGAAAAATASEAAAVPALTDGSICPVEPGDRPHLIACAIFVLGNLIGTTMTHELGHSLGLANPANASGDYHNNGRVLGRIMNSGGLRSFRERAELGSGGPAVFCDTDFAYLQRILPGGTPPRFPPPRPLCLD